LLNTYSDEYSFVLASKLGILRTCRISIDDLYFLESLLKILLVKKYVNKVFFFLINFLPLFL